MTKGMYARVCVCVYECVRVCIITIQNFLPVLINKTQTNSFYFCFHSFCIAHVLDSFLNLNWRINFCTAGNRKTTFTPSQTHNLMILRRTWSTILYFDKFKCCYLDGNKYSNLHTGCFAHGPKSKVKIAKVKVQCCKRKVMERRRNGKANTERETIRFEYGALLFLRNYLSTL